MLLQWKHCYNIDWNRKKCCRSIVLSVSVQRALKETHFSAHSLLRSIPWKDVCMLVCVCTGGVFESMRLTEQKICYKGENTVFLTLFFSVFPPHLEIASLVIYYRNSWEPKHYKSTIRVAYDLIWIICPPSELKSNIVSLDALNQICCP